jgi:hypothetical protein
MNKDSELTGDEVISFDPGVGYIERQTPTFTLPRRVSRQPRFGG